MKKIVAGILICSLMNISLNAWSIVASKKSGSDEYWHDISCYDTGPVQIVSILENTSIHHFFYSGKDFGNMNAAVNYACSQSSLSSSSSSSSSSGSKFWSTVGKVVGGVVAAGIAVQMHEDAKERNKSAKQVKHLKRVGNVVIDKKRNLMWQDDASAKSVKRDWNGAKRYCKNLSLDGYSDWRLPSYDELLSIVDYDRYKPAIFSPFKNIGFRGYWSSSEYVSDSRNAWLVDSSFGGTNCNSKSNERYVRCVRGR